MRLRHRPFSLPFLNFVRRIILAAIERTREGGQDGRPRTMRYGGPRLVTSLIKTTELGEVTVPRSFDRPSAHPCILQAEELEVGVELWSGKIPGSALRFAVPSRFSDCAHFFARRKGGKRRRAQRGGYGQTAAHSEAEPLLSVSLRGAEAEVQLHGPQEKKLCACKYYTRTCDCASYDDATLKLTARGNLDGQSKSQENSRRDGERKREGEQLH